MEPCFPTGGLMRANFIAFYDFYNRLRFFVKPVSIPAIYM